MQGAGQTLAVDFLVDVHHRNSRRSRRRRAARRRRESRRDVRAPDASARSRSATRIAGGVDALSGGTWLAIRARWSLRRGHEPARARAGRRRRCARAASPCASSPPPTIPSAYVAALDPTHVREHEPRVGRRARRVDRVRCGTTSGTLEIERLPRGIHVLCNDRLGAPGFPRGERLARRDRARAARAGRRSCRRSQPRSPITRESSRRPHRTCRPSSRAS